MAEEPRTLSRRAVVAGAGIVAGARLLPGAAKAAAKANIWSADYTAQKHTDKQGSVSLAMYRKRIGSPASGQPPLPVLFLVHGSSLSARTSYDLAVPGREEYSMMNVFAGYGFDVWTMDHENY